MTGSRKQLRFPEIGDSHMLRAERLLRCRSVFGGGFAFGIRQDHELPRELENELLQSLVFGRVAIGVGQLGVEGIHPHQ